VRLLAKSVALEHAADNIRCNSVPPGIIATPIWGKIPTGAEGNRRNAPIDPRERAALMSPIARVGEASDTANGVLFLCRDAALRSDESDGTHVFLRDHGRSPKARSAELLPSRVP